MSSTSRTMIQPLLVPQLVSSTIVPGRYRRAAGTVTSSGPKRKPPAPRSRSEPNTLGESKLGRHNHSTLPVAAISADVSQSDRNPNSPIGGNDDALWSGPVERDAVTPSSLRTTPG